MLQRLQLGGRLGGGVQVRSHLVILGEGCLDRRLMKNRLDRKLDLVGCAAMPLLRKKLGACLLDVGGGVRREGDGRVLDPVLLHALGEHISQVLGRVRTRAFLARQCDRGYLCSPLGDEVSCKGHVGGL